MNVLNGYAGLGGNAKYWQDCNVVAVEKDSKIAGVYKTNNAKHKVIIGDVIDHLLNNYQDYDFIWLSPPCQANTRMIRSGRNRKPRLPSLELYELKIFLDYNFDGKYVIENVIPYYDPPIHPTAKIGRHLFWSNFDISDFKMEHPKNFINIGTAKGSEHLKEWLGINYEGNIYYEGNHDPCQVLRNCVHPKIGKHVYECMIKSL